MRFPSLKTDRLIIRPFEMADWPAVHRYTSDPAVMTYIPDGIFTEAQARAFVIRQCAEQPEAIAVALGAEQQLIGHISFHPWFAVQTYEIGWVFHPRYYGCGYATEAAGALLRFGFEDLGLHRIVATCQPENHGSYRVMEKIGMRREGLFQQCIYRGAQIWWDELFYAILRAEWLALAELAV